MTTQTFRMTRTSDGAVATIEAEYFATDGAGTRFYDAESRVIASFAYGILQEVQPFSVSFAVPAPAPAA